MDDKVFLKRTVVLTTYQTLESDYRQQVNRTKVQCQWCGRLFQKQKLFYHQKYFCGPDAQRTEKQAKAQRKADFKDRLQQLTSSCQVLDKSGENIVKIVVDNIIKIVVIIIVIVIIVVTVRVVILEKEMEAIMWSCET